MKLLCTVSIFAGLVASSALAELKWEKTEVELQPAAGDAEATATFAYVNDGTAPVKILAVRPSCGCTVASPHKDEVAPGEKGELKVVFKIGDRQGLQQKRIDVRTDDPAKEWTSLMLRANITPLLEVKPTFVWWQQNEPLKPKVIAVKAMVSDVKKLEVFSADPLFKTEVKRNGNGSEWAVEVVPKDLNHPRSANIVLQPHRNGAPAKRYYATARVTPVTAQP